MSLILAKQPRGSDDIIQGKEYMHKGKGKKGKQEKTRKKKMLRGFF